MDSRSSGRRQLGARAAAGLAGAGQPRRGIAGIGQIGRYGARLGLRFDRGGVRDVRCPPGGLFGPGEAQSTEFGGHGGSRRRGTPEHGVRAARGATDYTNRPKRKRGRRYSYRVLGQRGVVEEGVAGEVERSRPVGGGDAVEGGRFPAS